jgi:hypothetical protein
MSDTRSSPKGVLCRECGTEVQGLAAVSESAKV